MLANLEELRSFLAVLKETDIIFSPHFYEKQAIDRPYLDKELIVIDNSDNCITSISELSIQVMMSQHWIVA